MKNIITTLLIVFIFNTPVWSQSDQSYFFLSPGVSVPTGPSVEDIQGAPYTSGFKLDGRAMIPLGGLPLALHTQAGLNLAPLSGSSASETLILLSLQAGPAFTMNLTDSLAVGAALQGGGYLGMIQGANGANGVFSARADVNLSLNSNFTVGVGGDYSYYLAGESSSIDHTWSGMGINLNLRYLPGQSRERESRLEIQEIIIFPVYPVLHSYYNTNGIGEVTVRNNEPGTIENVAVTFYVPKYMSGPQTFQTGETLKRGETRTLPIYGLLESSILEETEGTLVQAQVSVSYDLRSTSLTAAEGAKADILYRNALSWDDDRRAASFVTAKEPGLIEFAKNTTSSLRSRINREIDPALTGAMAMFEALSLYGIKYQVDPDSSYKDLSGQEEILDYLQFPIETLNYKSGDCDDMSVLYTAMLESLAIKTAFITVPGHIYTAVALEISPEEAQKTFADPQSLIYQDDRAWIPVETTMIDGSDFLAAWREGSRQWREAQEKDQARLYPVEQAWTLYPPVALNAYRDKTLTMPDMTSLVKNYGAGESSLIKQETATQTAFLKRPFGRVVGRDAIA